MGESRVPVRTWKLEVSSLLEEKVEVLKVVRQKGPPAPHKVEDVPEHLPVPVDEVVLLERVQHDGDPAAEHLGEAGVGVSENLVKALA